MLDLTTLKATRLLAEESLPNPGIGQSDRALDQCVLHDIPALVTEVERLRAQIDAVRTLADQLRDDAAYHESMDSDPAEIRTRAGWKNTDDYRQELLAAIAENAA